ncbi:phage tail protein [Pasteurella multocida]
MTEEFKWCVRPEMSVDNAPKVYERDFGDGYTQRQKAGINNMLRMISVVVKVKNEEVNQVDEFLRKHGGVTPFYFIDPLTKQKKKVVCGKWPAKIGKKYTEFSCDFKEVAEKIDDTSSSNQSNNLDDVIDLVAIFNSKLEQIDG